MAEEFKEQTIKKIKGGRNTRRSSFFGGKKYSGDRPVARREGV